MKGILFKPEMIRAILDGKKTMTRRIIKMKPLPTDLKEMMKLGNFRGSRFYDQVSNTYSNKIPYKIGEVIYVKEKVYEADGILTGPELVYFVDELKEQKWNHEGWRWKSPLFMPEYDARLFLKIHLIRVERLQDISMFDVMAEGVEYMPCETAGEDPWFRCYFNDQWAHDHKLSYGSLWDKINGEGSYDLNPWVWVIVFEKTEKPQL
jgi:hypothetical protein